MVGEYNTIRPDGFYSPTLQKVILVKSSPCFGGAVTSAIALVAS